jgi:glutathione S-transferase
MGEAPWLAGSALSLADLHAVPMIAAFRLAPEGSCLLTAHDQLVRLETLQKSSFVITLFLCENCKTHLAQAI